MDTFEIIGAAIRLCTVIFFVGIVYGGVKKLGQRIRARLTPKEAPEVRSVNQQSVPRQAVPRVRQRDEADPYMTAEYTDEPYKESRIFHDINHRDAYEEKDYDDELTELEKGIIFSEILNKPLSMRK